jgi:hypothetical protein
VQDCVGCEIERRPILLVLRGKEVKGGGQGVYDEEFISVKQSGA